MKRISSISSERGVTLIETLLAAAMLVIVVFAVLASLDAASHSTAVNRSRTVAASLAEQELERMRSLSAVELASYAGPARTEVVGKAEYTIQSRAEWVHDASGTPAGCDSDGRQADYIRITSTVRSGVLGSRVKPVELRSIVAPRVGSFGANQGTLAVQVKDANDAPVAGLPVTIGGPVAQVDATNELGCAVFGHIAAGAYEIRISRPGWVDVAGNQVLVQSANVTAGTKQTVPLLYAQAAAVSVSFDTVVGSGTYGATSTAVTAVNTGIPGQRRVFTVPTARGTIDAAGLFPFPDGYTFYSGGCTGAAPDGHVPNYFSTYPGFVQLGSGGNDSVTVREPALNMRVTRGNASATAAAFKQAYVVITSEQQGCGERFVVDGQTSTLTDAGTLQEPGLPFGTYTICADDRRVASSSNSRRYALATGVVLGNPAGLPLAADGTPQLRLWINPSSSSTRGQCT
jgi:Tfp pilus assembly protein PilV